MEPFIHLHVHTQYSLLDGQASIDALIDKAQKDGMNAIAVTDHGNMFGIKEFFNKVSKKNGKPLGAIKDLEKEQKALKGKEALSTEEQARLQEIPSLIEAEKKRYSNRLSAASAIAPATEGITKQRRKTVAVTT